eukprot:6641904-Ditylum_brightwellii.AAC.2
MKNASDIREYFNPLEKSRQDTPSVHTPAIQQKRKRIRQKKPQQSNTLKEFYNQRPKHPRPHRNCKARKTYQKTTYATNKVGQPPDKQQYQYQMAI